MRYLLYMPALVFFSLPFIGALVEEAAARRAIREKVTKRAAAKAAREAAKAARPKPEPTPAPAPKRPRGRPRKSTEPAKPAPPLTPDEFLSAL